VERVYAYWFGTGGMRFELWYKGGAEVDKQVTNSHEII
jgi:hypothetical protein